jgi:MinD-like ATPase involved in chromosome partitioning or flagellar assembly
MEDSARVRITPGSASHTRAPGIDRLRILDPGRWHVPMFGRPSARLIAIRGRAGAGKSTVAANLAIAMARLRSRVVLIDLDLENPVQHELFGVGAPGSGLRALLEDQVETLEQALTATSVRNLYLVSGERMSSRTAPANPQQQHRLMEQIWELDADVIIGDVGSTSATEVVDLFALGALRVVVSAADPRSIRRTYNLFKEHVIREIEHVAGGTPEGALLLAGLAHPFPAPMRELLDSTAGKPNIREAIGLALSQFGGRLIGNRVRSSDESDLMHAASRLMTDYLGISIPLLGSVEVSHTLGTTRFPGRPLLLGSGIDRNVRLFHEMAEQLLGDEVTADAARCFLRPDSDYDNIRCASPPPTRYEDYDGSPLPASLGLYMRRHPRFAVDWHGRFTSDTGRVTPVRIFELSRSGASISKVFEIGAGDRGILTFEQLDGQPHLAVAVVDARRPFGRVGLSFEGDDETAVEVAAIACARAANTPAL